MIKFNIEEKVLTLQDEMSCFHLKPIGFFLKSNISEIKDLFSLFDKNYIENESILAAVAYAKKESSKLSETKQNTLARKLSSIFPEEKKDIGKELSKIIKDKSCNYWTQNKDNVFHLTNGKELLSIFSAEKITVPNATEKEDLQIARVYRENVFPLKDSFYQLDLKKLKKVKKVFKCLKITEEETFKGTVSRGITEAGFKMILDFAKFVNEKNFLNIEISKKAFKIWTDKASLLVSLYTIDEKEIAEDDICKDLEALGFNAWQPDFYVPAYPDFETATETATETASETEEVKENVLIVYNNFRNVYKIKADFIKIKPFPVGWRKQELFRSTKRKQQSSFFWKQQAFCLFSFWKLSLLFFSWQSQLPSSSLLFQHKILGSKKNYINSPEKVFLAQKMARAGPK